MALNGPFYPQTTTVNFAVGTTSANVALPVNTTVPGVSIRVVNLGANAIAINFGTTSAVTASLTTNLVLPPNDVEVFTMPGGTAYLAAIAGATGNTLYATVGEGL